MSNGIYRSELTRQSLTDEEMLILLGISQWVFNSNCHFIIEMIDKEHHGNSEVSWFDFLSLTAGQINKYNLKRQVNLIQSVLGAEIHEFFSELITRRNMIMHSFPTGEKPNGYPVPMYRENAQSPYISIDKEYLILFIKDNEKLSSMIHGKRGY